MHDLQTGQRCIFVLFKENEDVYTFLKNAILLILVGVSIKGAAVESQSVTQKGKTWLSIASG